MPTRYFDTAEAVIVGGSSVFALSNITTILGIIILCLNLFLIGFKIYTAVKKAKNGDSIEDVEDAVQHSIDLLQDYVNKNKEETNGREDTSKE